MNDMVRMAHERHKQLAKAIAQREAEIEKLTAEAAKVDMLIELADELFARNEPSAKDVNKPVESKPVENTPVDMVSPDVHRTMPQRQQATA